MASSTSHQTPIDDSIRTSDLFNTPDADVVIRSSDNVDFYLHKKNLECATGGFPPAETPSNLKDVVHLTETANILEMLFSCIYPRPFPSLEELDFDTFMLLVEAAEKYQFFGMICACRLHMKEILYPTDPDFSTNFTLKLDLHAKRIRLLHFAIRHDVRDLIEELRVILVNVPLSDMAEILPPHIYMPWSLYREQKLLERLKSNEELSVSKPKRPEILNLKRKNQVIMINF
ncbi:hypothetical protein GGU11DRAFT_266514 [Lentinula aff. detonsa]|uniref:BTB domain-containing protein n=1 Tax=Lentinula aff. detonsa TaxID=2804958 RepID=A0AA38KXJ4_9AGAR|nr:hypothetical protein GGU10DRAFT_137247 [Lentinula aff. detonsa]KAJ3801213.1 hypothetical protein GGU11DRAFT_266514 [Lentinula aff. detonsa]